MTKRILIVDDDQDILAGTRMRLRAAGYETIEAINGEEAVQKAQAEVPDMVLMDIRMPKQDGLSALQEMAGLKSTQDIPVVISSASLPDQQLAIDAGAKCFIPKPFIGRKLVSTVSQIIDDSVASSQSGKEVFSV